MPLFFQMIVAYETHREFRVFFRAAYLIREIEVPRWADYSEPNIRAVVASYGLP